jgi:hypothetical protein
MTAPKLPSQEDRVQSRWTRGSTRAHLSKEVRSGARGRVVAPELTSTSRRGLRLRNTWQHWSSPRQEGNIQSWGTRDSAGAHLSKEARSGAAGHAVASEPTLVERCGPKIQLMWQCVDARPALYLDLELICGGTRSSGYWQPCFKTINHPRENKFIMYQVFEYKTNKTLDQIYV